jgi:hypothetical protein
MRVVDDHSIHTETAQIFRGTAGVDAMRYALADKERSSEWWTLSHKILLWHSACTMGGRGELQ